MKNNNDQKDKNQSDQEKRRFPICTNYENDPVTKRKVEKSREIMRKAIANNELPQEWLECMKKTTELLNLR